MTPIRIGDLNRRVSIQQRSSTLDQWGQPLVATWADLLSNLAARITTVSGRERVAGAQVQTEVTHEIVLRWASIFTSPRAIDAWRVAYTSGGVTRYFNVRGIDDVEQRRRWIKLQVTEGMGNGN